MHFIVLFGPPAVGKMTVGEAIGARTGVPVFHNHLSIDPVLRFFPFGSAPFQRLVDGFRRELIREVAASELPGLTFTFVWDFSNPKDAEFIQGLCDLFDSNKTTITFVELNAELSTRLERNKGPQRLAAKPTKRNVERSEAMLLKHDDEFQLTSNGLFPLDYPHILIDNTNLSPEQVAEQVIAATGIDTI